MSAPTIAAPASGLPTTPLAPPGGDGYSPGRIREVSDEEAHAISLFLTDHPEYAGQPSDVIQQSMHYRTRQSARAANLRHAEGIPEDWRSRRTDDAGPRLNEEM